MGAKKRFDHELNGKSVEEMESDIDDLKSQLEGRDDEVKASKNYLKYTGKLMQFHLLIISNYVMAFILENFLYYFLFNWPD